MTICIPTWQSEGFIDKTLRYARSQTWRDVRILVSIDQSDDGTEAICRRHGAEDRRVDLLVQQDRLGWAGNINRLLANVDSPYFCLYPHDDIIAPNYVETLLARLLSRPDAASVQADVLNVQPGGRQGLNAGSAHEGRVGRRIIASLVDPFLGEPLRSLIRTDLAGSWLRFPITSRRGFAAHQPFQTSLFAAGPSLHVAQVLYWRWSLRPGGMTDTWRTADLAAIAADLRTNAEATLELIDRCDATDGERAAMRFSLYLNIVTHLRDVETSRPGSVLMEPGAISAAFRFEGLPANFAELEPDVQRWIASAHLNLIRKEALHYVRSRDTRRARAVLRGLDAGEAWTGLPSLGRRFANRKMRELMPLALPADLRERLAL